MDEDALNQQIRKFLKKVGITSQREIEKAVRDGVAGGSLSGSETLNASVFGALPEGAIVVDEAATSGLPFYAVSAHAPRHTLLSLTGGAIGQGPPCTDQH